MRKHMTILRHDGTVQHYTMLGTRAVCQRKECQECGNKAESISASELLHATNRHMPLGTKEQE